MASILVVDDRLDDRDYLVAVLKHSGHRVLEAANGHQGIAMMQVQAPDLVVTDILMPGMDGFELIRQMRLFSETKNTPVLLFTGAYDDDKTRELVAQCPGVTILFKLSDPEMMLRTVEQLLGGSLKQIPQLGDGFRGAHLELLTTQLHEKVTDLEIANANLSELNSSLREALAEKTILLKEVHHRVKNNLAVIAGLLSLQAQESGSEAQTALQLSQQRVRSMALIHEHLYGSENLERVNFGEFAERLAAELYRTFVAQPELVKIRVESEPIELDVERAIPCGLILNELLLNAFKYAFIEGRSGSVTVGFRQLEPGILELSVEDDGVGMPEGVDWLRPGSLGLEIVNILTRQLDGTIELKRDRLTRFELRMETRVTRPKFASERVAVA